ncbi:MAG: type II secretion system minor pseudopilin GspJ, partial [Hyphomonas sp.]|nr:type II secretion system minor pseudopilin GspJ [Hyphomonas sp.]
TPPIENRSAQSGVTLIETLVALFVIAMMATAGAVMTSQSLQGARKVDARGAAASELSVALGLVASDLAAYTGRTSQDASLSEPAYAFTGHGPRFDGRLMLFVRNGWDNPEGVLRSDLQRIEYLIESGALIRRSWSAPDPGPATPMVEERLVTGLENLEARFGREDTWASEWMLIEGRNQPAPQKVELTFTFGPGDVLVARYLIGSAP